MIDAWNEFIFYSRKLDKDLSARKLEQLVRDGVVTKAEIISRWQELVERWDLNLYGSGPADQPPKAD